MYSPISHCFKDPVEYHFLFLIRWWFSTYMNQPITLQFLKKLSDTSVWQIHSPCSLLVIITWGNSNILYWIGIGRQTGHYAYNLFKEITSHPEDFPTKWNAKKPWNSERRHQHRKMKREWEGARSVYRDIEVRHSKRKYKKIMVPVWPVGIVEFWTNFCSNFSDRPCFSSHNRCQTCWRSM